MINYLINRGFQKVNYTRTIKSNITLLTSVLLYNMIHIHHTIYLHNLLIIVDICRNVALIVWFPDDRKSLLGSGDSCLNLVIVAILSSTQMFFELGEHGVVYVCTLFDMFSVVGLPCHSRSVNFNIVIRQASNSWPI